MKLGMLKEYLVGLGFSVDDKTFDAAMGKMKTFEKVAGKMAGNVGKSVAKGSAVAVAALASVTVGVTKYVSSVADADMATEKFARRMWMTETNARSLQNVLSAMGESMDSIYDVAANAELRSSFFTLRADAAKLEGGPEIDEAMVKIRNVQFEVQRLKLLLSYASRYIAYYLTQYLAVPMEQFRQSLKAINDNGESLIKVWGDKVAKVLSWIVRLFAAGAKAGMSLIQMIQRLPYEVKVAMLAIAALGAIMLNPFTAVILAIGAILLLLDDFYTWQRGGESMFGDTWQQLSDFQEKLANTTFESQALNDLKEAVSDLAGLFGGLGDSWDKLKQKLSNLDGVKLIQGILFGIDAATWSIRENFKTLKELIGELTGKIGELYDKGKGLLGNLFGKDDEQPATQKDGVTDGSELEKKTAATKSSLFAGIFILREKKAESDNSAIGQKEKPVPTIKGENNAELRLPKLTLPVMASPAMTSILNTNKHYNDIKQDNSFKPEVNVTVSGIDSGSIAIATAKEVESIMLRLMTPWSAARIKAIPNS